MKTIGGFTLIIYLLFISISVQAESRSIKVKSVFLFKFIRYTTWPETVNEKKVLCTYGKHPFGDLLEKINRLQKNIVMIKHFSDGENIDTCDLVYISSSATFPMINHNNPILIIGEKENFAEDFGMIEIVETPERIKLRINLSRINQSGLKMSARLLGLAEIVQ